MNLNSIDSSLFSFEDLTAKEHYFSFQVEGWLHDLIIAAKTSREAIEKAKQITEQTDTYFISWCEVSEREAEKILLDV